MTLRLKTLSAIGTALAALLLLQHLTTHPLLLEGFRRSEEEYLRASAASLQRLLEADVETFHARFGDWAYWDDMYDFAGDGNDQFKESNLIPESLALLGINSIAVIGTSGAVVYSASFDPGTGEFGEFPADLARRLQTGSPWLGIDEEDQAVCGLLLVGGKPSAISVRPILRSELSGPARGVFVVTQRLDETLANRLSWISGIDVTMHAAPGGAAEPGKSPKGGGVPSLDSRIEWISDTLCSIAWPVTDIEGNVVGTLRAEAPRRIYKHGLRTAVFNTAWLVGAGLAFGATVMLVMQRIVLRRVVRLGREVALAGGSEDGRARLTIDGSGARDELGELARSINSTLEALTVARRDAEAMAQEARQAAAEALWQRAEAGRLAMVAERTGNGVIIADAMGRIEWVNAGFTRMTGYSLDDVRGRTPGSVLQGPQTEPEAVARMSRAVREGTAFKEEVTNYRRNGQPFRLLIDAEPLHSDDGRLLGFMAIESDVTELREAEGRAAEQGLRLAMFIEHAPAAVAMLDREMRYIATSRRWLRDYGLEGQEIVGRSHYEVFPGIPDRWKEIHRRCLAGAVEKCDEDCFERPGRSPQWLRWEVRPWMTPNGEIGGLSMFTEDLTDQRAAQEALRRSEERFDLAVRGSNDGLWDWNHMTDEVYYSPRYCEQVGYAVGEIKPTLSAFWEMVHPDDHPLVEAAIGAHRERGEHYDVEFRLRHRNGEWRWMQSRGVSVRDAGGHVVRMVGFHTDVTDRHQATDRLRRYADDLSEAKSALERQAEQLEARSRDLERAMRAAESANRAKSDFLANMSHEIRTPMSAIIGYAEMLTTPGLGSEEQERCIETVRRNGDHLLALISDILDLSKIEADRMTVEAVPCEPFRIVDDAVSMLRIRAEQKGLALTVIDEGVVSLVMKSDPHRLRQVVLNLLGNALKFTEGPDGKVSVRVGTRVEAGTEWLVIEVRDTGIGISAEQVGSLFKPFTQADTSMTRRFGGTGLGLTISKRLVEMMNGSIEVASEPGRGSSFTVRVPVVRTASAEELSLSRASGEVGSGANPGLVSGRVLLAEDGPDNQRLINFHLSRAGYSVEIAANGRLAVEAATNAEKTGNPFDLILMDMQMPELDGYGATESLRRLGIMCPIVALTAHAMSGDREKCLAAGCNDHHTKPIPRDRLLAMVSNWVKRSRARAA